MDIKAKINELVEKIKNDPTLQAEFRANPIQAVEKLLGVDLPEDMVQKVVDGVKAKITMDKAGDALGALKKLF